MNNVNLKENQNFDLKPKKANKSLWNSALIGRNFSVARVIYWVMLAVLVVFMVIGIVAGKKISNSNPTAANFVNNGFGYMFGATLGPIIYGVVAVMVPIIMLTKEIDNTSLAISLVSNNSRRKVLVNKMLTIMFMWLIMFAITEIVGGILGSVIAPDGAAGMIVDCNAELWLGSFVLTMFTFFMASTFNSKGLVYGVSWAAMAISVVLPLIGQFAGGSAEHALQYISVYGFYVRDYVSNPSGLLAIGYVVGPAIIIGLGIGSVYGFQNRSLQL